jgi:diguanylate cyclase (GGDEF)-like protein
MVVFGKNSYKLGIIFLMMMFQVNASEFDEFKTNLDDLKQEPEKLEFVISTEPSVTNWPTTDRGRFYHQKGLVLEINDQIESAKLAFTQSIEIFENTGEPNGFWVKSLLDRSYMDYLLTNDPKHYCGDRKTAVEIARKGTEADALVGSLIQLTFCYQDTIEQFKTGLSLLQEATEIAEENNLAGTMTAMIHNATGNLYRTKQVHEKAYEYYQRAYDSWLIDQDKQDMFNMQHNLVGESIKLGKWQQASEHIKILFELAENSPDFKDFTFFAFYNEAFVAYAQNHFAQAIDAIEKALALAHTTSENYFVDILKAIHVIAYFRNGQPDEAGQLAMETYNQLGQAGSLKELKQQVAIIKNYYEGNSKWSLDELWNLLDATKATNRIFIKNAVALQSVTFDQRISEFQEQALSDKLKISQLELERQTKQNKINQLKIVSVSLLGLGLFVSSWFLFKSRKNYLRMSQTDFLTKVANRRHTINLGKQQLLTCIKQNQPFSMAIIDIDDFKRINDEYGHVVGDSVIKQVAQVLQSYQQKAQILGRIGGEEFAWMIPELPAEDAFELVEKARKKVAQQAIKVSDSTITVTISCGLSPLLDKNEPLEALMKRADQALYNAKSTGKNKTITWKDLNE